MSTRLAIAVLLFVLDGLVFAELSRGSEFDSNSYLHAGASAGIGFLTGVATQNMEDDTARRMTAWGLCMIPGVGKELRDAYVSPGDLLVDGAFCAGGIAMFEGVNVVVSDDRVALVGRW